MTAFTSGCTHTDVDPLVRIKPNRSVSGSKLISDPESDPELSSSLVCFGAWPDIFLQQKMRLLRPLCSKAGKVHQRWSSNGRQRVFPLFCQMIAEIFCLFLIMFNFLPFYENAQASTLLKICTNNKYLSKFRHGCFVCCWGGKA